MNPALRAITVTRTHEIACGHRVYGHESKCAHLHGHNYGFEFTCSGALDSLGRVIDFGVIKSTLCEWLETHWDHRMLLWEKDPLAGPLEAADPWVVPVPFNPTAENMADHLMNVVGPKLLEKTDVVLIRCKVWETSKCSATAELL